MRERVTLKSESGGRTFIGLSGDSGVTSLTRNLAVLVFLYQKKLFFSLSQWHYYNPYVSDI